MRVNERIRYSQVLLIDEKGMKRGVVSPAEGLRLAREKGLDLVEIAPGSRPPVCRIMDYRKWEYEQLKKEKLQRKKQRAAKLKEVRMHVLIGEHDLQVKIRQIEGFLSAGHKVKVSGFFKGREISHFELGKQLLEKVKQQVAEKAEIEQERRVGKRLELYLQPKG